MAASSCAMSSGVCAERVCASTAVLTPLSRRSLNLWRHKGGLLEQGNTGTTKVYSTAGGQLPAGWAGQLAMPKLRQAHMHTQVAGDTLTHVQCVHKQDTRRQGL